MISLENSTKEKYSNKISAINTKYRSIRIVQEIREKYLCTRFSKILYNKNLYLIHLFHDLFIHLFYDLQFTHTYKRLP